MPGWHPIVASARVDAPADELFALLADLREHWRLAGRWVHVLELGAEGGVVRLRGPLGLGRTARTRVVHTEPPTLLAGEAELGRTRAAVSWTLHPDGDGTHVTLSAHVLEAGAVDRAVLRLGGRPWLRARFRTTLVALAAHAAESVHDPEPMPVG